jgi:hypothetical protein
MPAGHFGAAEGGVKSALLVERDSEPVPAPVVVISIEQPICSVSAQTSCMPKVSVSRKSTSWNPTPSS